jgi:hypothetical protein
MVLFLALYPSPAGGQNPVVSMTCERLPGSAAADRRRDCLFYRHPQRLHNYLAVQHEMH